MKMFVLAKPNLELAEQEVLSLTKKKQYELYDNLLVIDSKKDFSEQLGYSHEVYEFLFKCKKELIEEQVKKYDWNKIYKENFYVKTKGVDKSRELGAMIYNTLKKPVVEVKNPKTTISFFYKQDYVFAGLLISKVDKSFLKRKAHLRPELHPTSLHPGLARVLINLTGLTKGKLLDPFCGSAGILIEAGLMGFKITGYDIEKSQVQKAEINLEHYKIKDFKVSIKDALTIKEKHDCIVTDLPYGKNSKAKDLEKLYSGFLKNSEKVSKNMVIVFPDFVDAEYLIKNTKWQIKNKFSYYVHKSMTRKIFKLVLPYH